jgi:hypothetical protein
VYIGHRGAIRRWKIFSDRRLIEESLVFAGESMVVVYIPSLESLSRQSGRGSKEMIYSERPGVGLFAAGEI